jgi:lysozyme
MRNLLIAIAVVVLSCNSANESNTSSQADTASITINAVDKNPVGDSTPTIQLALPFVWGIDISQYQGDEIEFLDAKKDTLTFVICKATEGLTMIDPEFKTNWNTIDQKGFVRGAYHFYHCIDDPVKQANHFLSTVNSFEKEDFPPIIDFEEASVSNKCPVASVKANLLLFLQQVETKTGRTPIIYTDNNTGGRYLNDSVFLRYPLFIADYNNGKEPRLPVAWRNKGWALWQKSESYRIHSTTDDFDVFNGSIEEFNKFIGRE